MKPMTQKVMNIRVTVDILLQMERVSIDFDVRLEDVLVARNAWQWGTVGSVVVLFLIFSENPSP